MRKIELYAVCLIGIAARSSVAADSTDTTLFRDSIQSTKQSIAHETLDAFYHDALDYYHDGRMEEAVQLLDKIYSIDPHYQDVASLRESIRKKQLYAQSETTMVAVREWMKKANDADRAGQRVLAISYWRQALAIAPQYAPAQQKILEANQALAKKEFEAGYIHHHHAEFEEALDSWSNAIALDPTYKQRGLLSLMSKLELRLRRDRIARLSAQGFDQYQQGLFEESLQSYDELSRLEPRHEEARRMTAKIRNQLGQTALKAAQAALAGHAWPDAIEQADKAMKQGYEVSRSSAIKAEAEQAIILAARPKPKPKPRPKPVPVVVSTAAAPVPAAPPPPTTPAAQEEALVHYRQGMAAIRKKDFHLAMDELDAAAKLDPTNERIYMARERARQEWNASNTNRGLP